MLIMQIFISFAVLGLIGMLVGVWKIRQMKAEFEARNRHKAQEIFAYLGRMESLGDVQRQAGSLTYIMKRCGVQGVIAPLNRGARVRLQLRGDALNIALL